MKYSIEQIAKGEDELILRYKRLNEEVEAVFSFMNAPKKKLIGYKDDVQVVIDYGDIYGNGQCEENFGKALKLTGLKRKEVFLQSKCGICSDSYNLSKNYILESVDKILQRLQTPYLDSFFLHRSDALVEPEEIAEGI